MLRFVSSNCASVGSATMLAITEDSTVGEAEWGRGEGVLANCCGEGCIRRCMRALVGALPVRN